MKVYANVSIMEIQIKDEKKESYQVINNLAAAKNPQMAKQVISNN